MSIESGLSPYLKKMVDANISGLDIIHGELKNLIYDVEREMENPGVGEEVLCYLNGKLDAYVNIYQLTYELAFEIGEIA